MEPKSIRFSESDIGFTIERFAFYGKGKGNAKLVISELCDRFGIEDVPSNHKFISNRIRTFNPNRRDCKPHYLNSYLMKRNHILTHRHEPDGSFSQLLHTLLIVACRILSEKMTPALALKLIETESRFAVDIKNLIVQESIARHSLADDTGDSSFIDGKTEPDSRKLQMVSENPPRKS